MTKGEINAAVDSMPSEVVADLKAIVYGDSPTKENEARMLVELYHYFPDRSVVQDEAPATSEPRLFDRDETQRDWEAWDAA